MAEAAIFLEVGWTDIKGILRRHRLQRHNIPVERLRWILKLRRLREERRRLWLARQARDKARRDTGEQTMMEEQP